MSTGNGHAPWSLNRLAQVAVLATGFWAGAISDSAYADVNATNDEGATPLDKMLAFNRDDLADLLRRHGAKAASEL